MMKYYTIGATALIGAVALFADSLVVPQFEGDPEESSAEQAPSRSEAAEQTQELATPEPPSSFAANQPPEESFAFGEPQYSADPWSGADGAGISDDAFDEEVEPPAGFSAEGAPSAGFAPQPAPTAPDASLSDDARTALEVSRRRNGIQLVTGNEDDDE